MKRPKKVRAGTDGKAVVIREFAGDWVTANYYIKFGLTRHQVKALTAWGRKLGIKQSPCAALARYLVSLALLNPKETELKLDALFRYIKAEGFSTLGCYCDGVLSQRPFTGEAKR